VASGTSYHDGEGVLHVVGDGGEASKVGILIQGRADGRVEEEDAPHATVAEGSQAAEVPLGRSLEEDGNNED